MIEARKMDAVCLGSAVPLGPTHAVGFSASGAAGAGRKVYMGREDHSITFAPTGAGKGTTGVIPLLLSHEGPAIVFDPKGEAAHVTAAYRRSLGQKVFVVDPLGVTGLKQARFNPLDLIDLTREDYYDEARALADSLLLPPKDPKNQFWLNQARQVVSAVLIEAVHRAGKTGNAEMGHVLDVFSEIESGRSGRLAVSDMPEVAHASRLFDLGANETLGGIMHFVHEAMEMFYSRPIRASLTKSSFRLADLVEGRPMTVYFVLPPHMLRSHARLIRLWLGALMQLLSRRGRAHEKSTLFVVDEAAQLGPMEMFVTLMTLMRGYGAQCASFWQDPAQLMACYPDDWKTLRNNARLIHAFGQTGQAAMRDLEVFLGYGVGSLESEIGRRLCQVDGQLMRAETRDYRSDPLLAPRAEENPFHAANPSGRIERPVRKLKRRKSAKGKRSKPSPYNSACWMMEVDLEPAFAEHLQGEIDGLFAGAPEADPEPQG
ncbi:MAG: type IV secretory system conjugative DNA transfer family protein [Paracoccaceae bacterium]